MSQPPYTENSVQPQQPYYPQQGYPQQSYPPQNYPNPYPQNPQTYPSPPNTNPSGPYPPQQYPPQQGYPPQNYPPSNTYPYPPQNSYPLQNYPPSNPNPQTVTPQEVAVPVSTPKNEPDPKDLPKPASFGSKCCNVIIILAFLITVTITLLSFQWAPAKKTTTEFDESAMSETTKVENNSLVAGLAILSVVMAWFTIGIFQLNVYRSRRFTTNVGMHYAMGFMGAVLIAIPILPMAIDSPVWDSSLRARLAVIIVCCVWVIFIGACVYTSKVTEQVWATYTNYWSNGAVTTGMEKQYWGYIRCRHWPCCCC